MDVGLDPDSNGFRFDNEQPRHQVLVEPYRLADRLVTCGEWLAFMADGGYETATLWLSDGWHHARSHRWEAPLYWQRSDSTGEWIVHTLHGRRPVDPHEPVCHVSFYEADAFAAWAGARLPTEVEWEAASSAIADDGTGSGRLLDDDPAADPLHPASAGCATGGLRQMIGDHLPQFLPSAHPLASVRCAAGVRPPGCVMTDSAITINRHLDSAGLEDEMATEIRRAFTNRPIVLAPRWLYDDHGSDLFDRITRLDEYYPTEAERSVLLERADEIAEVTGADTVVELGSGTSDKTRTLLDAFHRRRQLSTFVPLDVNERMLRDAARMLASRYDGLAVHALVGDFNRHLRHIPRRTDRRRIVAFLGGTIGNFHLEERRAFLGALADQLRSDEWLLLGVDLVKPLDRIVDAYFDDAGLTERFIKERTDRHQPPVRRHVRHRLLRLRATVGRSGTSSRHAAAVDHAPERASSGSSTSASTCRPARRSGWRSRPSSSRIGWSSNSTTSDLRSSGSGPTSERTSG